MIAIGIGCQTSAQRADIAAAIDEAVRRAGKPCNVVASLSREPVSAVIAEAAAEHKLAATFFTPSDLLPRSADCITLSAASVTTQGLPSVAEAAALVAAGDGSRLILSRFIHAGVTAAVAVSAGNREGANA